MRRSRTNTGRRVGMVLLAVVTAVAVSGGGVAAAHSGGSGIEVKKPWARASAMEASNGAVYMVLKNESASDNALVAASVPSSVAAEVQIHETVMSGDSMDDSMDHSMDHSATATTMGGMDTTATTMGDMGGSATMQMHEVDGIDLPAGKTVKLEPGGYHVMLLDLVEPLEAGTKIKVTLEFEHGKTKTVKAVVKK